MDESLFALFDPLEEVDITRRFLPHWEQSGKTYFITVRTADSLPAEVVADWLDARNAWLRTHQIDPRHEKWRVLLSRLPIELQREYHRRFSDQFEQLLDNCHGACVLRLPTLARIVAQSLLHFDRERYEMSDFVVMPNHVHLMAQFATVTMKDQCESWKHYTAVQINRSLGTTGRFWQGEPFDTLVRSEDQFKAIQDYIADNPRKAKLKDGEFIHYTRKVI